MNNSIKKIVTSFVYILSAFLLIMYILGNPQENSDIEFKLLFSILTLILGSFILIILLFEIKYGEEILILLFHYRFMFSKKIYKKNRKTRSFKQELIAHLIIGIGLTVTGILGIYLCL